MYKEKKIATMFGVFRPLEMKTIDKHLIICYNVVPKIDRNFYSYYILYRLEKISAVIFQNLYNI